MCTRLKQRRRAEVSNLDESDDLASGGYRAGWAGPGGARDIRGRCVRDSKAEAEGGRCEGGSGGRTESKVARSACAVRKRC